MLGRCIGEGKNPYTVNVITFSGHGLTVDGDAIAVIPTAEKDELEARFINMSGIARKFAEKKCTLNIFICSMCRVPLSLSELTKIYTDYKDIQEE
jgi:hypothetical protein